MNKLKLKLKKGHPANKMRLGRHVITNVPTVFELNESEMNELKSTGGQAWFMSMSQLDEPKEKPARKPAKEKE